MAPEIRTVLRYIDDYINSGDYESAVERAISAVKGFDEEREFSNSRTVLERLIEVAQNQNKDLDAAQFLDLLKVRLILARDQDELADIKIKYQGLPKTPLDQLIATKFASNKHIIVESIEMQDIFGDYSALKDVPYLRFTNSDDAIQIIEDFYDEGRYLINLLDTTTSLHQAINVDIGQPEEVNIVDREHIFRLP